MRKKIRKYLLFILIVIFFFLFFFNQKLKCLFYEITGLWCPGCGITRMIIAILRLDFYQAFRYNSFVFSYIVFAMGYILYSWIRYQKIKELENKTIVFWLISAILFCILRNIPYFSFLAPTVL